MPKNQVQQFALSVTRAIGSPTSIILHSIFFVSSFFIAIFGWVEWSAMLLVLTTVVSLEAIYLSIFIQMTINITTESIEDVSEDIEEMQEDIGEIQEDVDEIQGDVDELQEDVEDISEDVGEMSDEDQKKAQNHALRSETLTSIQNDLQKLISDFERLKNSDNQKN